MVTTHSHEEEEEEEDESKNRMSVKTGYKLYCISSNRIIVNSNVNRTVPTTPTPTSTPTILDSTYNAFGIQIGINMINSVSFNNSINVQNMISGSRNESCHFS